MRYLREHTPLERYLNFHSEKSFLKPLNNGIPNLVLKNVRHVEAHRISRHKARGKSTPIMDAGRTYYAIFLKVFTFYKAYFDKASQTNASEK